MEGEAIPLMVPGLLAAVCGRVIVVLQMVGQIIQGFGPGLAYCYHFDRVNLLNYGLDPDPFETYTP